MNAIKAKKGSNRAIEDSERAMSEELFDCTPRQLFKATDADPSNRSTLPKDAQKALIVGETIATHDLNQAKMGSSPNSELRDAEITETVRESAQKVRKLFPW